MLLGKTTNERGRAKMKCNCGHNKSTFLQKEKRWLYHTCDSCGAVLGERIIEEVGRR